VERDICPVAALCCLAAAFQRFYHYNVTPLHTHADRTIQTCLDVSFYDGHWHSLLYSLRAARTDWCSTLFRLATSVFVFFITSI